MAQPVVSTSNPVNNETDVFLNIPLQVTFATPGLLASSINVNSVMLLNVATQTSVPVDLSYEPSSRVLTIKSLTVLAESTVYKIRFVGTDVALSSSYVLKESGSSDPLLTTIDITFTTGTRVYLNDAVVTKDIGDLSLEGDLTLPSNIKAIGPFALESAIPKNYSADVSTSLDGSNRIRLKFNKNVASPSEDWINVDVYPILDDTSYLAASGTLGTGTIPSMTGLSYSGQYIYLNFDNVMPNNVGVDVTLGTGIVATDGSSIETSSYKLSFTVDRFPKIAGVHMMKNELLAAADELNDNYIAAVLFKNTIRIIHRWSAFTPATPQWIAHKWIVNQSILDILEDKDLEKALVAGTRKTLGDFTVSVDNLIGQMALKYKRAQKEAEDADGAMAGIHKLGARIEHAVCYPGSPDRLWHNVNGKIADGRFRYWQSDVPQANIDVNRTAVGRQSWWF